MHGAVLHVSSTQISGCQGRVVVTWVSGRLHRNCQVLVLRGFLFVALRTCMFLYRERVAFSAHSCFWGFVCVNCGNLKCTAVSFDPHMS